MKNPLSKLILPLFVFSLFAGILLIQANPAAAQVNIQDEFGKALVSGKLVTSADAIVSPEVAIGKMINAVLTYIGVFILVLVIYAGGLWAVAQGNEKKIETSKKILTGSVIGLLIIFSAAGIVNFVIARLGASLSG